MKRGEIISLGRHKLMCGDATSSSDIGQLIAEHTIDLILTDPPYGMECQKKSGTVGSDKLPPVSFPFHKSPKLKKYPLMIGDTNQETARINYELTQNLTKHKIIFGGQYFTEFLPVNGGWIFWDKQNGTNDFSDGELAWRSWGQKVCKYEHMWSGMIRAGSPKLNGKTRYHPTQKPVELLANILEDFCAKEGVVLNCFGGSGATLIACEITGRTCLMMEMSPEYCDIVKARYESIKGNII